MKWFPGFVALIFLAVELVTGPAPVTGIARAATGRDETYFGLTAFPYDISMEAVGRTRRLVSENSTIYAFHLDDGIPWTEALEDRPFPKKLREDWSGKAAAVPAGHRVYLGLAPLSKDRKTLAPSSEGSKRARKFSGDRFDDEDVMRAYLNYARRAVETFEPDYLNLGIEAGELAGKGGGGWDRFVKLYRHVRAALKNDYPSLSIGISFGLHSLVSSGEVGERARPLLRDSDYIGISFYPYTSSFGEKFGAAPLPGPPAQWREPLEWLRDFTDKPIAICETGYSTVNVDVPAYDLHMEGSEALQKRYLEELAQIARRDGYLFVVWFLAIDYDALYEKIPEGDGSNRIWRNTGLLDGELREKPAWQTWKRIVRGEEPSTSVRETSAASTVKLTPAPKPKLEVGFREKSDLFQTPDQVALTDEAPEGLETSMRWSFDYKGRWHWATKSLRRGRAAGMSHVSFWVRSNRDAPMFFQIEEDGGETFFEMVFPSEDWKEVHLNLNDLNVDPKKQRDRRLDPSKITQILIADNAGADHKTKGSRSIWISDLTLYP